MPRLMWLGGGFGNSDTRVMPILEGLSHLGGNLQRFIINSRPKYDRTYPSRIVSNNLGFHLGGRRDMDLFPRVHLSNMLTRIAHVIQ
jgi:hypothetical protein